MNKKKMIAELCSASMCLSLASFIPAVQCNAGDVKDAPAVVTAGEQETEKVIKNVYVDFESVPQFYYNTETSFDSKQIKKAILHVLYAEQTKDSENPEVINEYEETTDITKDVRLVDATPKMMFDSKKNDVVYEIPVYYDGDSIPGLAKKEFIQDSNHKVINIKAYIGLKGDTNLDNRIDAVDASRILNYYTQSSTDNKGKPAMLLSDNMAEKDKNYEEFSAFLSDVQTAKNTKKDKNAKKEDRVINAEDAAAIFKHYSYASVGKDMSDAEAAWNEINGKDESDVEIDDKEISASKIKPVIEVSKEVYDTSDDIAGKTVTVTFKIGGENVDGNYCTTGFHVYWDKRIKPVYTSRNEYAEFGLDKDSAGSKLFANQQLNGEYGVFLTTSGKGNEGKTGTLWTMTFKLPDDAKPGDVFPIDVAFEDGDLFKSSTPNTYESRIMQAYLETYGINSEKNPSIDLYLIKANADYADGYIAIADKIKTLAGDVNNDGAVNLKDVVLIRRYIAGGWGVELDEKVADVNKDGAVNLKDVVLIRRYIAGGWGVTL